MKLIPDKIITPKSDSPEDIKQYYLDGTKEAQMLEMMADYKKAMDDYYNEQDALKKEYRAKLKGLINVTGLFRHCDEDLDSWTPEGIFAIEKFVNPHPRLENAEYVKIVDNANDKYIIYEKVKETDLRGVDHYYVWQRTTSMEGDSYAGFLLYPLKDGRYFKLSYSC